MFLALLACGREPPPTPAPADAPNVLLVTLDTVRADHTTPYGYERDTTPALAALARGGARFTHSYAQAPATTPTHASLFTGRLPQDHGCFGFENSMAESELTLAEHLRANGYRTMGAATSMKFDAGSGLWQGFDAWELFGHLPKNERSDAVRTAVSEFAALPDARPFFAFAHLFDAHAPYAPPEPWLTRWHPGLPSPEPARTVRFVSSHQTTPVEPEVLTYLLGLYDGGLGFADQNLAALLSGLHPGNGRETLVIVTSDHGEAFKEHGYLGHSEWLHEEIVRVPLVVSWPGRVTPGLEIDAVAQSVDLFPTLVELLHLPAPPGLAGRSLAPALLGGALPVATGGPAEVVPMFADPLNWALAATLDGRRFKLVKQEKRPLVLFDLDTDPGGHVNVAGANPGAVRTLRALGRRLGMTVNGKGRKGSATTRSLSDEQREQLRAIGYEE